MRTYSELIKLKTFEERFRYLMLNGKVGEETFGHERYLNQIFYSRDEWKAIRNVVISRDLGRDLGVEGYEIYGRIYVHHMNPICVDKLLHGDPSVLDPEFLICTSYNTHNAIHYGDENLLPSVPIARKPNDTCPWKKS